MNAQTNSLNWFEIPVKDMARAKHFYQVSFGIHMHEMTMMHMDMAMFPNEPDSGKANGALVRSNYHTPSTDGVMVYLNANPDLQLVLNRISGEGGQVIMQKTLIDEQTGYMAFFIDTEGNRIGLHSQG
jgi:predicted enzyme related to lactoylglutathione lyase